MKIAFLFNGQGSQFEKMAYDFYQRENLVRDFYDSLDFDLDIKDLSFKSSLDILSKTKNTQPTILAFHIALVKLLESKNIIPDVVLGLSLGEYSALYTAGVLNEEESLKTIIFRSQEMSKVETTVNSKMLASMTDDLDLIKSITAPFENVFISNVNTVGQIVISGEEKDMDKVDLILRENNIKTIPLNTSGPFHTPYMDGVAKSLLEYFKDVDFKAPNKKILFNLYGKHRDDVNIKKTMSLQVSNTVLFKDSLLDLVDEDIDLFIEIGSSKTIGKFIKKIDKKIKVFGISTVEEFDTLLKEVESIG